jgi:hypothetical protein
MQHRLYFGYYRKSDLFGTLRADVQPHRSVESRHQAPLVQSGVCKQLQGALPRSENAEIANWNGGDLL